MTKISISQRAAQTPASAIRKLVPFANAAKKKGLRVYHVNIGDPDLPTPAPIRSIIKKYNGVTIGYAPSTGLPETVEAWSTFYRHKGYKLAADDIMVTSGGSEALIFAFFTAADPGTELIVFEPFYTSYAIIAAMGNIILRPVRTYVADGFHLPDRKTIEKAINKKTRGIVVCNPNNPTGTMYTPDEVKMIRDIAVKHNLFIISDETYQELVYDGRKVLPFASFGELSERLVITDSISKRFNSCGVRIGSLVSRNREFIQAALRFAQGRLSVATVEQLAAVPMLINHQKYVAGIREEYMKRRDTVLAELSKIKGATAVRPEGAFYIIPRLPISDSDDFARYLLTDFSDRGETVMVAPATGFYKTPGLGRDEIRIAYVLDSKKLKRAIELLGLAVERYNRK